MISKLLNGTSTKATALACLFLLSFILAFISIFSQPARADYNYSFGNSRVVVGGNGLAAPSGSYIGAGTMSASARGQLMTGAQVNPALPNVPWGSTVGTAGDNRYGAAPIPAHTASQRAASVLGTTYEQQVPNNGLPRSKWGANIGTAGDQIRSDLNPNAYANNQRTVFRNNQIQTVPQYTLPGSGTAIYAPSAAGSSSVHF